MRRKSRHDATTHLTMSPESTDAGHMESALKPTPQDNKPSQTPARLSDRDTGSTLNTYSSDNQAIITPPSAVISEDKSKHTAILLTKAAGITAIAFLLSFLLSSPFAASLSALFSSSEKSDFNMTDLFFQIADNRPVRTLEDRIAILDIGNLNRLEIADLLEVLSLCEPKAVAIDVNFETTTENDSLLLNALSHLPALVLPLGAEQEGDRFTVTDHPFFYGDFPYAQYGIVNLPTSFKGATVRNYAVSFPMTDGATMLSFPEAAAKAAGFPTDSGTKDNGSVPTGIIAYHSKEIPIIAHDEMADNIEQLHDKIVLVGTTSEAGDVYATPLRRGVSGMLIHAYALSSILDGSRLTRMPAIIGDLTAVAICYVMVLAAIGIKSGIRGLLIRLGQITALYFLVWAGYSMLVDHEIVGDFSQAILMVAFGLFSVDLWNGTDALIKWIRKKVHRRRSMQLNS